MNASFSKRFSAFVIDLLIISLICNIITWVIPVSDNYKSLSSKLNDTAEVYSDKIIKNETEIDIGVFEDYINEVSPITYQMEKETFISKIIIVVVYIAYYIIYQYKNNGQTLGKKFMKIKVEKQDGTLQINDMIFRSFIINSVLSSLIYIILLFTTKNMTYLICTEIVSIIFGILILVSGIMCIARKDKKTLQDIITKTHVVEMGE